MPCSGAGGEVGPPHVLVARLDDSTRRLATSAPVEERHAAARSVRPGARKPHRGIGRARFLEQRQDAANVGATSASNARSELRTSAGSAPATRSAPDATPRWSARSGPRPGGRRPVWDRTASTLSAIGGGAGGAPFVAESPVREQGRIAVTVSRARRGAARASRSTASPEACAITVQAKGLAHLTDAGKRGEDSRRPGVCRTGPKGRQPSPGASGERDRHHRVEPLVLRRVRDHDARSDLSEFGRRNAGSRLIQYTLPRL